MTNITNIKTVPNQKIVTVNKEPCDDKGNTYTKININAMDQAGRTLDAGAFKLWCYFAKNQPGYNFALSRQATENNFGIKKKQYDNGIKELIEKGYLVNSSGNYYNFYEIPVVSKSNHEKDKNSVVSKNNHDVVSFGNYDVVSKSNHTQYPKDTRNITDITINTTYNITDGSDDKWKQFLISKKEIGTSVDPVPISGDDLNMLGINFAYLNPAENGLFKYQNIYLKPIKKE